MNTDRRGSPSTPETRWKMLKHGVYGEVHPVTEFGYIPINCKAGFGTKTLVLYRERAGRITSEKRGARAGALSIQPFERSSLVWEGNCLLGIIGIVFRTGVMLL
jgi:hypothetical protein